MARLLRYGCRKRSQETDQPSLWPLEIVLWESKESEDMVGSLQVSLSAHYILLVLLLSTRSPCQLIVLLLTLSTHSPCQLFLIPSTHSSCQLILFCLVSSQPIHLVNSLYVIEKLPTKLHSD